MEKDYIGNLRVLASVHNNTVSEQSLEVLRLKFGLGDAEMEEMKAYCAEHGISIYDEIELIMEREEKKKAEEDAPAEVRSEMRTERHSCSFLSYREEEILRLLYGIGVDRSYTYRELAEFYHVSPERIKQIWFKAERRIRHRRRGDIREILLELFKEPDGEEQLCLDEDTDIDTWGLSVRTYNCLKRAGYNDQHDFEGKHIADIASIRGMQEKSLQEILQKLKNRGLELD